MNFVQIDVVSPLPESWGICLSCEALMARANLDEGPYERGLDEYPPEWRGEFQRLSQTVFDLADRYQNEILIRLWDPRSLQGLWKSIRFGIRRYPTFVVNGRDKVVGLNLDEIARRVDAARGLSAGESQSA